MGNLETIFTGYWKRTGDMGRRFSGEVLLGRDSGRSSGNVLTLILIALVYSLTRWVIFTHCHLDEADYFAPAIIVHGLMNPAPLLSIVVFGLIALIVRDLSWRALKAPSYFRCLMACALFPIIWASTLYQWNFYFNQSHFVDRLVIALLFGLSFFRPAYFALLLPCVYLVLGQFDMPLGFSGEWTNRALFIELLLALIAGLVVRRFREFDATFLAAFPLVLVAEHYLVCAIEKVAISPNLTEWVLKNPILNLIHNAHNYGWPILDLSVGPLFLDIVSSTAPIVLVFTLGVELMSALELFSSRLSRFLCLGRVLLHLGIYLCTGVFFWNWIALNICLLLLIRQLGEHQRAALFNTGTGSCAALLMIFLPSVNRPNYLGWFDSPITSHFHIMANSGNNNRQPLPPSYFAPYDYEFAYSGFFYLIDQPVVGWGWGAVKDYELLQKLEENPADIWQSFKLQHGNMKTDPERSRRFNKFLREFVSNKEFLQQERGAARLTALFEFLAPPAHVYMGTSKEAFGRGAAPELSVIYREVGTWNRQARLLNSTTALQVLVPLRLP